ncbi:MAG: Gfo/Idh/MocA family oxidoreductase [Clostridiales bacterium]|nr:Gfo/Idh/MocA family oxidoreductase [Clostridiales bacterium]
MNKSDGMSYAPKGRPSPVVKPGEFYIAAVALDHGHIYGMINGLTEAGATLKWVYDPDPAKVTAFIKAFPQAQAADCLDRVLDDPDIKLVAGAAIPNLRARLGIKVMNAGKDYFTDKTPLTTLEQLDAVKEAVARTGKKYMVYYSERLHVECAMYAGDLIEQDAIGRVINVIGAGPHRLNAESRPGWFFDLEQYGGILCDIGSHQIEQFLYYAGAKDATIASARVGNFNHPEYPELQDFGDCALTADNGAAHYFRVDWFTPKGLSTWGDGRTFILGADGFIELRKYVNLATNESGNHLFIANSDGERHLELEGKVGFPFFGRLINDCVNRTEIAMTQSHALKAAELCVKAQAAAVRIHG